MIFLSHFFIPLKQLVFTFMKEKKGFLHCFWHHLATNTFISEKSFPPHFFKNPRVIFSPLIDKASQILNTWPHLIIKTKACRVNAFLHTYLWRSTSPHHMDMFHKKCIFLPNPPLFFLNSRLWKQISYKRGLDWWAGPQRYKDPVWVGI